MEKAFEAIEEGNFKKYLLTISDQLYRIRNKLSLFTPDSNGRIHISGNLIVQGYIKSATLI